MIGCPVLTDLAIVDINKWDCAHTLYICSTSLCKFELYINYFVEDLAQHYAVIDTPKATHLTICDRIGVSYDIRDVSLLVNASFTFNGDYIHASSLPWQKISHACELFLELHSLQNEEIYESHCVWDEPIEVPRCFSSSLEIVEVPAHIRVMVESDDPEEYDMQMISYILKNAIVLKSKKLNIGGFSCMDLEEENKLLKTVLTLQRGLRCMSGFFWK